MPSFLSCREGTRFTSQHPSQHLRAVSRDMPGVIWGMTGGYVSWELSSLPQSRQITTTGRFSLLCIICPGRPCCWHWDEVAGRTRQGRSPIPHPAPSLTLPFPAPHCSPREGCYPQEADANPAIKHLPSASLVQAAAKPCWPETSACPLGAKGKCPHATRNLLVDFNTWPRDEVAPWATSWLPRKAWVLCVLGNLLWDPGLGRRMYFLKQNDEQ